MSDLLISTQISQECREYLFTNKSANCLKAYAKCVRAMGQFPANDVFIPSLEIGCVCLYECVSQQNMNNRNYAFVCI